MQNQKNLEKTKKTEKKQVSRSLRQQKSAKPENPHKHELPDTYHADMIWSQELLWKLMEGEPVSRTITMRGRSAFGGDLQEHHRVPALLSDQEMRVRVKEEKMQLVFQKLKRSNNGITVDLDSPSPAKRSRPAFSFCPFVPNPERLPGLPANEVDEEVQPINEALEALMGEDGAENDEAPFDHGPMR